MPHNEASESDFSMAFEGRISTDDLVTVRPGANIARISVEILNLPIVAGQGLNSAEGPAAERFCAELTEVSNYANTNCQLLET